MQAIVKSHARKPPQAENLNQATSRIQLLSYKYCPYRVTPVQDTGVEGVETAIATITASPANYIVGPQKRPPWKLKTTTTGHLSFCLRTKQILECAPVTSLSFYMGATEALQNSFERTLPAGDPEGDKITWKITGASSQFAIDSNTGRLFSRDSAFFPFGTVVSLTATVAANSGSDTASVKVYIATDISLKSINYTTDHALLRTTRTGDNLFVSTSTTSRYNDTEWMAGKWADPLTHSMGTKVSLMAVRQGVPAGIPYVLIGDAPGTKLDFFAKGITGNTTELTAKTALPNMVGKIDKPIR